MKRMMAYGFWKSWRTRRLFLIICAAAALLLIPATGTMIAQRWEKALVFCYTALFVDGMMLLIAPFIWAVSDYIHGISGTRSVLERAVAAPAWQKLLARLIVSMATIVVFSLLGLAIFAGTAAVTVGGSSSLQQAWRGLMQNLQDLQIGEALLRGGLWGALLGFFQTVKLLLLIWFAVALAKSFPGSRKAGVFITILIFVLLSVVSPLLAQLAAKVPLYTFTLYTPSQGLQAMAWAGMGGALPSMTVSLSALLLRLAVTVLAFCGTSWLMEHRVEG